MADGDATYDAVGRAGAGRASWSSEQLDMVVGARKSAVEEAYRRGHRLGNRLLHRHALAACSAAASATSSRATASSRGASSRSFPALSRGFETETEISVHALELAMPVGEVRHRLWRAARRLDTRSCRPIATAGGSCARSSTCSGSSGRSCSTAASACSLAALAIVLAIPLAITYVADRPGAALPDRDPRHRPDDPRRDELHRAG